MLLGYVTAGFGVGLGLVPRSVTTAAGPTVLFRPLVDTLRPANRLTAYPGTSFAGPSPKPVLDFDAEPGFAGGVFVG